MGNDQSARRVPIAIGLALIVVGAAFLLRRAVEIDVRGGVGSVSIG